MTTTSTTACRELFETARRQLRAEQRRTVDEREAFKAFETQVRGLDGGRTPRQNTRSTRLVVTDSARGLDGVKRAYESTVMAVPHYEDEYNESFADHVTGEFGPEIATLLTQGSTLDAQAKRTVLAAATQAQETRDALLDAFDAEAESFTPASKELCSVAADLDEYENTAFETAGFGTLDAYRLHLTTLAETCQDVVDDRQEALLTQRKRLSLPVDGPDIPTYVYQNLRTTYPVVSTATTFLDRIQTLQEAVEQALIYEG